MSALPPLNSVIPVKILIIVDFPAPFGPINPKISPYLIPKVGDCKISIPLT